MLTPECYTLHTEMAVLIASTGVEPGNALFSLGCQPAVSTDGSIVEASYFGDSMHFVPDPNSVTAGRPAVQIRILSKDAVLPYLVIAADGELPEVYTVDATDLGADEHIDYFRSFDGLECAAAIQAASAAIASLSGSSLEVAR